MEATTHHYHPTYKYYVGTTQALEDPNRNGIYLLPKHSTQIALPSYNDGEIPIFDPVEEEWSVIPDNRGIYYSTSVGRLGDLVEILDPRESTENLTKEKPPSTKESDTLRVTKIITWNDGWVVEEAPEIGIEEKINNLGISTAG